jgi:hypothetical protein
MEMTPGRFHRISNLAAANASIRPKLRDFHTAWASSGLMPHNTRRKYSTGSSAAIIVIRSVTPTVPIVTEAVSVTVTRNRAAREQRAMIGPTKRQPGSDDRLSNSVEVDMGVPGRAAFHL